MPFWACRGTRLETVTYPYLRTHEMVVRALQHSPVPASQSLNNSFPGYLPPNSVLIALLYPNPCSYVLA